MHVRPAPAPTELIWTRGSNTDSLVLQPTKKVRDREGEKEKSGTSFILPLAGKQTNLEHETQYFSVTQIIFLFYITGKKRPGDFLLITSPQNKTALFFPSWATLQAMATWLLGSLSWALLRSAVHIPSLSPLQDTEPNLHPSSWDHGSAPHRPRQQRKQRNVPAPLDLKASSTHSVRPAQISIRPVVLSPPNLEALKWKERFSNLVNISDWMD